MRWVALCLVFLSGCAAPGPALARADLSRPPAPEDWGPRGAELEWWYVASSSPEAGLAFHVAFFKAEVPRTARVFGIPVRRWVRGAFVVAQACVTDLVTGARWEEERSELPLGRGTCRADPLRVGVAGWQLSERADGGFRLCAGPLTLDLDPGKPRTVHPPGWSEGVGTGRMLYQSITRLPFRGSWRGRPLGGVAWMDHQWGDVVPAVTGRWDWHGLHLDSGEDVMLYDVTRPDGSGRRTAGTWTDAHGVTRLLDGVKITPTERFTGRSGHGYDVAFRVRAADLDLTIAPLWCDQETLHRAARLTYWEGPVRVVGTFRGRPVTGHGMGEHLPAPAERAGAPRAVRR